MTLSRYVKFGLLFLIMFIGVFIYYNYERIQPVDDFELELYMGKWYELARYSNNFQSDCICSTAEYTLQNDSVNVLNTCYYNDGTDTSIEGTAYLTNKLGVFKVSFFPFIKSDYRVVYLDNDYGNAIVTNNRMSLFWLLSRNSSMENVDSLLLIAEHLGFDTARMVLNKCEIARDLNG